MNKVAALAVLGLSLVSAAKGETPELAIGSLAATPAPSVFTLAVGAPTTVTGLTFQGQYLDLANPSGWASDLRMIVRDSEGATVLDTGGFGGAVNPWAFQGSASSAGGAYSSEHAFTTAVEAAGDWSVEFMSDAPGGGVSDWSNVNVGLGVVPTPGSALLIGLGAALALRRRAKR